MNIVKSNISFASNMSYGNIPDTIVFHHAEASSCSVYDIDRWHKERGWAGIAYHYFVKKDGTIYTGRPENAIGAHTKVRNTNSIGICAEGMYMTETMPEAQKNAIVELSKDISSRYNIQNLFGHRELMPTSCPGDNYPLNEIKALILNNNEVPKPNEINTDRNYLMVGDKGERVAYLQKSLIAMGFSCGPCGADGDFGKATKNALINFQQAIKISVDGLAGNETFRAIDEIMKTPTDGIKYPHYEYASRYIQYKVGAPINGLFNSLTALYVKDYQAKNNLSSDGVVGPKTWGKLLN